MRTATVLGLMAVLVAGGGLGTSVQAQEVLSTTGQAYSYPTFTGSAAVRTASINDSQDAAARRHTLRHMRHKILDLLPTYNPFRRMAETVPALEKQRRTTHSGGEFSFGPVLEGNLGQDAEVVAGMEMRFTQPFHDGAHRVEVFAIAEGMAQARDIVGASLMKTGHALRAGLMVRMGGFHLAVDQEFSSGIGVEMEGPSESRAHLTYALRF